MSTRCLICDSSAVISTEAVSAVVLLISALQGFIKASHQRHVTEAATHKNEALSLEQVLWFVTTGVRESRQQWADNQPFLQDVQRFQFMQYECMCLRCGAMFDEATDA